MTGVEALEKELSAWTASDGTVPFWWRDDDLGNPTSALDPLLTAAEGLAMRPVLAAVPALTTPDLKKRLSGAPADIAVHGLVHIDHQAGRGKKAEFGDARPLAAGIADADDELHGALHSLPPPCSPATREQVRSRPGREPTGPVRPPAATPAALST